MKFLARWFFIAILSVVALVFIACESHAIRPHHGGHNPTSKKEKRRHSERADLNKDEKVDAKEKHLGAERREDDIPGLTIVGSGDETGGEGSFAGFYKEMDLDNDGKMTKAEVEKFYETYDTNGNGVLEESEIKAVTDK